MTEEFQRVSRLPPYVFSIVSDLRTQARRRGEDVIDFGMGNPDQPTPRHIVDKLCEAAQRGDTHRYSTSRGIPRLLQAIAGWYRRKFDVELDPESEAIVTIGSKEGLAHLALAVLAPGDLAVVPNPAYPIHPYSCVIAGAELHYVPMGDEEEFLHELRQTIENCWPKPKMLLLNFPCNPTGHCVGLDFYQRIVEIALEHRLWVVQDIAYAELVYDGYAAPSILQARDAKRVAVEFYTLSKSYNMPGWRVGFMCGNARLVSALGRVKSYVDYGLFTPVQVAAIAALEGPQDCVEKIRKLYQERRDVLCDGLNALGWPVEKPRATMFVWAPIPPAFADLGSLEFSKLLLKRARVAVSPGIGFGQRGNGHVRFSLIENAQRTRQALRGVRGMMRDA